MNVKIEPIKIRYKYDLMHRNTPKFAKTEITWDCAKMTPITYNRVIRWLEQGHSEFRHGDAVDMYAAIRKQLKIPRITILEKNSENRSGYMAWSDIPDYVYDEFVKIYKAERVIQRMENGTPSWYLKDEMPDRSDAYFYYESKHDFKEVKKAIKQLMSSEQYKQKVEEAISFCKNGGQLKFTYDPQDRG